MVIVPLYGAVDKTHTEGGMYGKEVYTYMLHNTLAQQYVVWCSRYTFTVNCVYSVFSEAKVVDDMPGRAVWARCSIKLLMSHLTGPD